MQKLQCLTKVCIVNSCLLCHVEHYKMVIALSCIVHFNGQ